MPVNIENATTSALREAVLKSSQTHIADCLLTRKTCVLWLKAHDIHQLSQIDEETFTRMYQPQPTCSSRSFEEVEEITVLDRILNDSDFEINEISPVSSSNMVRQVTNSVNNPGGHDGAYDIIRVQNKVTVANKLMYNNESLIDLMNNTLTDIRQMNSDIDNMEIDMNIMKGNVDIYEQKTIDTTNLMGEVYDFQIVSNSLNVTSSNEYARYLLVSSIITLHVKFMVESITSSSFSLKLPYPIEGRKNTMHSFRLYIKTSNTNFESTTGKLYTKPSNSDELFVESGMFAESENFEFPLYVQIDGNYMTTEEATDKTWITPMRFDLIRNNTIVPKNVTIISNNSLSFIRGRMQANFLEERVELVTNSTYRIENINEDTHEWTIDLSYGNPLSRILGVSGYGSTLLIPSNQYTIVPPDISVNTSENKLHIKSRVRTGDKFDDQQQIQVTTHVIYYIG